LDEANVELTADGWLDVAGRPVGLSPLGAAASAEENRRVTMISSDVTARFRPSFLGMMLSSMLYAVI